MKTTKFLQAVSLLLILVIAVSCRSGRSTTGREYPRNSTPPVETSTNTYPAQTNPGNLPPGQAKKIYGGQSAKAYAPGQRKKYGTRYPLVIVYSPGIVISRHIDGRYYYRNAGGYTYWKGNDGRYYIDEKHLKEMEYEEGEYDDWKFKGQKNNNAQQTKGKEKEETVKEDQKTKDTDHIAKVKEQKGMGQNQKMKDTDQKGKDQPDQKAKDVNPKEKDQTDQKAEDNDQKEKGQSDQKAKDKDEKGKDQTDQKGKDDNSQKGKAKSKNKA